MSCRGSGSGPLVLLQRFGQETEDPNPALLVQRAAHSYGGAAALAGVTFSIEQGEIYCLLGPNGAGKSTLLRAITGRLGIDSGTIRVDRRLAPREAAAQGLVGYVPQEIALYRHLTVRENLAFFGRMAGLSRRDTEAAVARMLARAELEREADRIVSTLSGGYQRRVNIAAAALTEPFLLVLDEPTVGIDIQAREAIHTLLLSLREAGAAILLTTHDLDQAQALASRIGILDEGRLVLEGEPARLIRQAFGNAKELIVELHGSPDRRGASILKSVGLAPTHSPSAWSMALRTGAIDAAAFTDDLAGAGIDVKEVRIRQPDLASLFLKAVGAEKFP
jgi:ABC-2 type transport system ATP-binding protein